MMTKSQAGKLGGLATVAKYGNAYMTELAKRGAKAFHEKYRLVPVANNDFALVYRSNNQSTGKTLNGRVFRKG